MRRLLIVLIILAGIGIATGAVFKRASARSHARAANTPFPISPASALASLAANAPPAPNGQDAPSVIRFVKDPSAAPPFLTNDVEGQIISSAALHGKAVLLVFWATWCPPCRAEVPELIDLANKYKNQLQIVAVSEDDDASPPEVRAFAHDVGMNYPVLMDGPKYTISDQYGGVVALPTSFVIDPQGRVVQKHVGLLPEDVYETEIRSLTGLPINAKVETFEDVGQVFMKNANRATSLPGIDMSKLTPEQRKVALKRMNTEGCTCGCKLTVAQCRLTDNSCATSLKLAQQIVKEVASASPTPISSAKND